MQFAFRTRTFACLNWIHCTYADAALGTVSCKDVLPSLIFRNYCRRREDGRSEDASRRPFRTVVLAPGMQIIVRRGVRVCVRACVQGGETDPRMQIEPTSHGTPAANELAGLFADVDTCAFVCAHNTPGWRIILSVDSHKATLTAQNFVRKDKCL